MKKICTAENIVFASFLIAGAALDSENRVGIMVAVLVLLYQLYRMGQACRKEDYEE